MRFGPVPIAQAEGAVLAHSLPLPKGRMRKGRVLGAEDLAALAAAGFETVTVARLDPGDVDEDTAADRLARALVGDGPGLRLGRAATGRVNIYSEITGVARIDPAAIDAVNAVDPMITVATVPRFQRMAPGGMVATVKIISYGVPESALAEAERLSVHGLCMAGAYRVHADLVQTLTPGDDGTGGHQAIADRLSALTVTLAPKRVVPHRTEALAEALTACTGDLILILTASATSDIADVAPAAVVAAGGSVTHFGMPVDPGNLLFLGELSGRPVIGLPGCARSPALNGADWVLERVVCGVPVTGADIAGMGVGGLLKDIPTRPRPRRANETGAA